MPPLRREGALLQPMVVYINYHEFPRSPTIPTNFHRITALTFLPVLVAYLIVPTLCADRYTQMLEARHFGRDAEIQRPRMANFGVLHCPNEALVQASSYRPWPGYRYPCRYDDTMSRRDLCITTSAGACEP